MIGIIGAMQIEVDNVLNLMSSKKTEVISGIEYYKGTIYDESVVVAKCGIGKVFAGICAQTMIIKYNVSVIVNIGVAGGMISLTNIGDVVIAKDVVQHDMDTSPLGDPKGMISGINIVKIPCSKEIVSLLDEVLATIDGVNHLVGTIATGDKFLCDTCETRRINSDFEAIAFDMESGAIGQVCYINNIKFGIIRSISDNGSEEAHEDFNTFAIKAANISTKVVVEFIKSYKRK